MKAPLFSRAGGATQSLIASQRPNINQAIGREIACRGSKEQSFAPTTLDDILGARDYKTR
jgi:hypothetical protein